MKRNTVILIMIMVSAFFSFEPAISSNKKELKTSTFSVFMDCESCAEKIKNTLAFEKGVKQLKYNVEKNLFAVTFDARKNSDKNLIEAMKKIGYEAKVIEDNKKPEIELK